MIEYVKLEVGEWFIMPENYDWYKEKHFLCFIPEPKTFEEFKNSFHLYYDLPEDVFFEVHYYSYHNFAILRKNCMENKNDKIIPIMDND